MALIQSLLGTLFNDIFAPIISGILQWAINMIIYIVQKALVELVCRLWIMLLKLVFIEEQIFKFMSGMAPVTVHRDGNVHYMRLLDYFFTLNTIGRAFLAVTLVAVMLAFIFAAFETAKSISDMTLGEDRAKPVSTVLKNALKSALMFGLIPVLSVTILNLSGAILSSAVEVFNSPSVQSLNPGNDDAIIGTSNVLFVMCCSEAGDSAAIGRFSTGTDFADFEKVKAAFDIEKIDYFMGIVGTLLIMLILAAATFTCARRIFDLMVLYIVSPYFASTIALDGGEKFKGWRELFIAKFFNCFGAVFAIEIFLIVMPNLVNSNMIVFSPDPLRNNLTKMILLLGGAFAVFTGSGLVMNVLNPAEAQFENNQLILSLAMGAATSGATFGLKGIMAMGKAGKNLGQKTGSTMKNLISGGESGGGSGKGSGGGSGGGSGSGDK